MRPLRLTLSNFMAYGQAEIDMSDIHVASLIGHNGAGKSTLLDALTWALYGQGRASGVDDYVRQGEEQSTDELEFELSGDIYRIIRTRSIKGKGKSTLELAKQTPGGWLPLSGTKISETEQEIKDLLRMDYDTFVSSCFILQEDSARFSAAGPAERKRILAQILGLDVYDQLQDKAKEQAKALRDQVTGIKTRLEDMQAATANHDELKSEQGRLQGQIEEHAQNIKHVESNLEAFERELADARAKVGQLDELRNRQRTMEIDLGQITTQGQSIKEKKLRAEQTVSQAEQIRTKAAEHERTKAQLEKLDQDSARYLDLSQKASHLERAVTDWDKQHEAAVSKWVKERETEISRIESALEAKRPMAETLNQVPCSGDTKSSCKLLASARQAADEIANLESRLVEVKARQNPHTDENPHIDEWQQACRAQTEVNYNAGHHRDIRSQALELERWARMLPELEQAELSLKDLKEQLSDLQARWQQRKTELGQVKESLSGADELQQVVRTKESALSQARQQLSQLRSMLQDNQVALGRIEQRIQDLEEKAKEAELLKEQLKIVAKEQTYLETLVKAFGKNGIPALIVENALPDIESIANDLLGRLTGGRMSVELVTQKATKTAGISETLDIVISDELGARPYQMWSGAERFETDIALRLAISKYLARRAGTKIETLVIDEGASCLDDNGRVKFVEAINTIAEDFRTIIIISHIDALKEAFPQQIVVQKSPEGSKLEVVS